MMLFTTIFGAAVMASAVAAVCPAATRQAAAEQLVDGFNLPDLGASAAAFSKVPFGSPDEDGACYLTITPDDTCAIPVASTGKQTYDFAVEVRQVFDHVDAVYTNFDNGTTFFSATVHLGVRSIVPLPADFIGNVFLDFTDDCRIYQARAFAVLPSEVLGQMFSLAGITALPAPVCDLLPV